MNQTQNQNPMPPHALRLHIAKEARAKGWKGATRAQLKALEAEVDAAEVEFEAAEKPLRAQRLALIFKEEEEKQIAHLKVLRQREVSHAENSKEYQELKRRRADVPKRPPKRPPKVKKVPQTPEERRAAKTESERRRRAKAKNPTT